MFTPLQTYDIADHPVDTTEAWQLVANDGNMADAPSNFSITCAGDPKVGILPSSVLDVVLHGPPVLINVTSSSISQIIATTRERVVYLYGWDGMEFPPRLPCPCSRATRIHLGGYYA